jgi:SAM-dependent methyltransferase
MHSALESRSVPLLARIVDAVPRRIRTAVVDLAPQRVKESVPFVMSSLRQEDSPFVTSYLGGLRGVEIGAASHNRFFLDAVNVDRTRSRDTLYKKYERRMMGRSAKIDIVAPGDDLPFDANSHDFVFSSHVIEHFPDPIKALREWVRVASRYVVVIAPHRDRTFDSDRPLSTVDELLERNRTGFISDEDLHWSVWTCESFLAMCEAAALPVIDHQDPDDKVGNGFTVVIDASGEHDHPL